MEEEQKAGALMVMVLEVEAATQSSLDSDAGGAANEVTKYEFEAAQGLVMLSEANREPRGYID
jgi:hypothetical protein